MQIRSQRQSVSASFCDASWDDAKTVCTNDPVRQGAGCPPQAPERSWTDIIHELGYFDQAHFIRECHAFAGLPPGSLIGDWDNIFFPADD